MVAGKARQVYDSWASDLVDVGLYASSRPAEINRIGVMSVVGLGCKPTIEVVAIANQESTGVGRVLPNPISVGVFCEEPRALKANFCSDFLCDCVHGGQCQNAYSRQYCSFDRVKVHS